MEIPHLVLSQQFSLSGHSIMCLYKGNINNELYPENFKGGNPSFMCLYKGNINIELYPENFKGENNFLLSQRFSLSGRNMYWCHIAASCCMDLSIVALCSTHTSLTWRPALKNMPVMTRID